MKIKKKEEKRPILTPLQQNNQSHHKNTLYVGNIDSYVSIEDIYELFGLKSTAYLRGHVCTTAPKQVCDE